MEKKFRVYLFFVFISIILIQMFFFVFLGQYLFEILYTEFSGSDFSVIASLLVIMIFIVALLSIGGNEILELLAAFYIISVFILGFHYLHFDSKPASEDFIKIQHPEVKKQMLSNQILAKACKADGKYNNELHSCFLVGKTSSEDKPYYTYREIVDINKFLIARGVIKTEDTDRKAREEVEKTNELKEIVDYQKKALLN